MVCGSAALKVGRSGKAPIMAGCHVSVASRVANHPPPKPEGPVALGVVLLAQVTSAKELLPKVASVPDTPSVKPVPVMTIGVSRSLGAVVGETPITTGASRGAA